MSTIESVDDFWSIVDGSEGDFARLEATLSELDATGLVAFHGLYTILSWDAVYEDVVMYEEGGYPLSEDGIEDFGWWIVTQGRAYFDAVTGQTIPLQTALRTHFARPDAPAPTCTWTTGEGRRHSATNFLQLAEDIHRERFGTELELDLDRAYAIRDRSS